MVTHITVLACCSSSSDADSKTIHVPVWCDGRSMSDFQRGTTCSPTVPVTPRPGEPWKPSQWETFESISLAANRMAAATGCSLPCSTQAAKDKTWDGAMLSLENHIRDVQFSSGDGPCFVQQSRQRHQPRRCRDSLDLKRIPFSAPRPIPTITANGVRESHRTRARNDHD